ncbi:MAG TPA: hypothetical protein VGE33_01115 [Thermomonas sp.]
MNVFALSIATLSPEVLLLSGFLAGIFAAFFLHYLFRSRLQVAWS